MRELIAQLQKQFPDLDLESEHLLLLDPASKAGRPIRIVCGTTTLDARWLDAATASSISPVSAVFWNAGQLSGSLLRKPGETLPLSELPPRAPIFVFVEPDIPAAKMLAALARAAQTVQPLYWPVPGVTTATSTSAPPAAAPDPRVHLIAAKAQPASPASHATIDEAHDEARAMLAKIYDALEAFYESERFDARGNPSTRSLPPSTPLTPPTPCCKRPDQLCDAKTGWTGQTWSDLNLNPPRTAAAQLVDTCAFEKRERTARHAEETAATYKTHECSRAELCALDSGHPCSPREQTDFPGRLRKLSRFRYQYQFTSKGSADNASFVVRAVGDPLCDGHEEIWEVEFRAHGVADANYERRQIRRVK